MLCPFVMKQIYFLKYDTELFPLSALLYTQSDFNPVLERPYSRLDILLILFTVHVCYAMKDFLYLPTSRSEPQPLSLNIRFKCIFQKRRIIRGGGGQVFIQKSTRIYKCVLTAESFFGYLQHPLPPAAFLRSKYQSSEITPAPHSLTHIRFFFTPSMPLHTNTFSFFLVFLLEVLPLLTSLYKPRSVIHIFGT